MDRYYNRFRRLCAFIIGAVFFVSGLLKLLDPVGTGLVISEYYKFFGTDFLQPTSKVVGESLAMLETLLGAALMTGLWRRVIAVIALIFLCGFTLVTVILVVFNPTMDCGCFGEAVHLTHLQSLIKNLILLAFAAVAFTPIGKLGRPKKRKYISFSIVAASVVAFAVYSLVYIPLVDFTDFAPSSRLKASVKETAESFEATFIYEKDGQRRTFTLENIPDSSWTYVETITERTDTQEVRPDLPFRSWTGEYKDYLATSGKVITVSIYDVQSMKESKWQKVADLVKYSRESGYTPLLLVAADPETFASAVGASLDEDAARTIMSSVYYADYKTLMTLNRSNAGATYFHDGYLIRKWAFCNLPSKADLQKIALVYADESVVESTTPGHLTYQAFLIYSFALMLFL